MTDDTSARQPVPLRVAFLTAEAAPLAKVGGLGDVAGSLPRALARAGVDTVVVMPRYGFIDLAGLDARLVSDALDVRCAGRVERFAVYALELRGARMLLLDHSELFGGTQVYVDLRDRERFAFFCHAVPGMLAAAGFDAQVLHANDWHTAPALLETGNAGRVFTIHNMAHQGITDVDYAEFLGWPTGPLMDAERHGKYPGKINLMARAIAAADVITTVSPRYAQEIMTPEYGAGLDTLLRERADHVVGILNGIDTDIFDPSRDPALPAAFSVEDHAGKAADKAALQREMGLAADPTAPLLGIVSRLDDQKGIELVIQGMDGILATGAQVAILGTGLPEYHEALERQGAEFPGRLAVRLGFDVALAQRIYAGSDMFLMPSRFEPCGLGQMIAMRYGSVPVVRATGGLADTVSERPDEQTGFTFDAYDAGELVAAVERAVVVYRRPKAWLAIVERAMCRDVSWDRAAGSYVDVYRRVLKPVHR